MSFFNLTFLTPLALLGLLALGIPIYLHLRHKPRAESYRFPAIDFLLKAQKKKKRRFKAEQLWLMLFRLAIICFLAFLFAKPFLDEQFGNQLASARHPLIFLLDDTPSMLAGPTNARFFDEAKQQLSESLERLGSQTPCRLILASDPLKFTEADTAGTVSPLISTLKVTTRHATLDAGYAEALSVITAAGWEQSTLRIYTDGSRSAWRELPGPKPDGVEIIYHSMRASLSSFSNVGITGIAQPPGDANSIEVNLLNSSDSPQQVALSLESEGQSTVSFQMRMDAHAAGSHYFALPQPVPASLTVTLPEDDFVYDNALVFVPQTNKLTRILIVDGDTHPEAVNNESFFLKNALGFEESEKYGYKFQVVTPSGFSANQLDQFDVFYVLNVDLPATTILNEVLARGKGLFIGMGERMDQDAWNAFFRTHDLEMWEVKTLPGPQALEIREPDFPIFRSIDAEAWQSYLAGVGINKFRLVSTGRSNAKIPLALGDGSPLLLSRDEGKGRLLVWTSSLDVDWNNFPLEFGFVPFVRQVTDYLSGMDVGTAYTSLTVDEVITKGLEDQLTLKYATPDFVQLAHDGPKPGVYTRSVLDHVEFVNVGLDPAELNFKDFSEKKGTEPSEEALAGLGFQSYARTDLAPSLQWLLFLLLLLETFLAGRITLKWGAR